MVQLEQLEHVKRALDAQAVSTTLDVLKQSGRTQVRVIRAEHIAAMVSDAVQKAVEDSGLLSQEQVESLVHESRREFQSILETQQKKIAEAKDKTAELERVATEKSEVADKVTLLKRDLEEARQALRAKAKLAEGSAKELEELKRELEETEEERNLALEKIAELEKELLEAHQTIRGQERELEAAFQDPEDKPVSASAVASLEVDGLETQLAKALETIERQKKELEAVRALAESAAQAANAAPAAPATPAAGHSDGGANAELLFLMMKELASLKASLSAKGGESGVQPAQDGGGMADALDRITATINERLDKFGRKMGISSAVEGAAPKLDNLFKDDGAAAMESNMGNVEAKEKKGGGIMSNLAKLRKLKGGD